MRVFAKVSSALYRHWRAAAVLLLCAAGGWAQAQSVSSSNTADPPSRVARLSYMAGDVGFQPAGASAWSDARINRPLTTGDRLSTGANARAELEFGGSNLRMDGGTDFGLLDLSGQIAQIELTQGTLSLSVRDLDDGQSVEIDTPTVALVVDRPGTFRVDVGDGTRGTRVAVLGGAAVVYGENNAQRNVSAGRSYQFEDSALSRVGISDIAGGDAFDAWGRDRDQRYVRSDSRQYVSDQVVGYQDLDQYGDWQTDNDYGAVWYPAQVSSGWAPYRDGHWAYIAPWGWSWVDDAAWGFAPYHYGRWANMRGRWGWIPGPINVRPIYAPALVAFVGGGGWSVGIGSGPVGWFPLGPGEIYNPWYHASRNYYTNVNITNIYVRRGYDRGRFGRDIDDHYDHYRRGLPVRGERYANRDAPRGFTAVSGRTFASGQQVQGDVRRVEHRELATAAVLPRGIAARPAAASVALPRNAHTRSLPIGGFDREVVARRAPPSALAARADVAVRGARGGQRQAMAPSRVRLLTQDAQGARPAAQDVSPRALAVPADMSRDGGNRVAAQRGGALDRVDAMREGAAQRRANGGLVRNHEAAAVRPMPANVRGLPQRGNLPGAADAATAVQPERVLPDVAPIRRADLRSGELPSARFARPDRRTPVVADGEQRSAGGPIGATDTAARAATNMRSPRDQRGASPRPGLSIISAGDTDRAVPSVDNRRAPAQSLPQVPRFQRDAVDNADPPPAERQAPAASQERVVRHNNAPMNDPALQQRQLPARFERPEPAREAPRQESRQTAPRQMDAAPPQQYQPRREMPRAPASPPPPRMVAAPAPSESAAPARSEGKGRPAPRSTDHPRRDDQQN